MVLLIGFAASNAIQMAESHASGEEDATPAGTGAEQRFRAVMTSAYMVFSLTLTSVRVELPRSQGDRSVGRSLTPRRFRGVPLGLPLRGMVAL